MVCISSLDGHGADGGQWPWLRAIHVSCNLCDSTGACHGLFSELCVREMTLQMEVIATAHLKEMQDGDCGCHCCF